MTVNEHSKLDAAYRATAYVACLPDGPLVLRVDALSPGLDRLLRQHGNSTWAFISAGNPQSRRLTDGENLARQAELVETVENLGLDFFAGQGIPEKPYWNAESGLLILGITRQEAHRLADKFDQKALLFGTLGGAPQLQYTIGNQHH